MMTAFRRAVAPGPDVRRIGKALRRAHLRLTPALALPAVRTDTACWRLRNLLQIRGDGGEEDVVKGNLALPVIYSSVRTL